MNPKSNIKKGKRAEDFIAQEITKAGLGKAMRTKGSGCGLIKGDVFANLPFSLEVKNQGVTKFLTWIDQAKRDSQKGNLYKEKWSLIIRDPRFPEFEEVYAVIDFWQFLHLLKKNQEPLIKEPDRELKFHLGRLKETVSTLSRLLK